MVGEKIKESRIYINRFVLVNQFFFVPKQMFSRVKIGNYPGEFEDFMPSMMIDNGQIFGLSSGSGWSR